ncbi:MAG: hypothetical protein ACO2PN_29525 [Pyrobaculum sp.]|jgi:hypothetical protein
MAVASALALGLQPILALAKQPEEMLKQQAGRRVVVEIQNVELWKDSDATVLHTVLNVSADREYSISAYVVRDAPSIVILPGIVISRTSERTDVVALGGDDEYVYITDTSNLSDEELEWWSYQYSIYEVENFVLWLHVFFVGWGAVFVAIAAALAAVWVIAAFKVAVIKFGATVKGLP